MKPYIDYEYAKNIYENGFTSGFYDYYEVIAVAKWMKQIEKLSKNMMKKRLYEFCEKHDKLFNRVTQREQIRKIINTAMNEKLNNYPTITITEKELSNIESVKNFKYQKFLFSVLVYSKRVKFQDFYEKQHKDDIGYTLEKRFLLHIWNKLGVKISKNKLMKDHISKLKKFIEVPNGSRCKILFSEDNSRPIVEIDGTELAWIKYVEHNGGECFYCEKCGEKEKRTNNRQKLCKKHSMEKENNRVR